MDDLEAALRQAVPGLTGTDIDAMRFFARHLREVARAIASDLMSGEPSRFRPTATELREVCRLETDGGSTTLTGLVVDLLEGPASLTLPEAARALGTTVDRVRDLVERGELGRSGDGVATTSVVRRLAAHG